MNAVNQRTIVVDEGERFLIRFPYDPALVSAVKQCVPMAQFDRTEKQWVASCASWREVEHFAKSHKFLMAMTARLVCIKARACLEESRATDSDVQIPAPDGLEYLPFQKAGIIFASKRKHVLIADQMGLGKTIQAIGVLNMVPEIQRALVVCPASLKLNWYRELNKWLVRKRNVAVADSSWFPPADIVVMNYDIMHRHEERLRCEQWDYLICDEAHYMKNPKARRTMMVLGGKDKQSGREIDPISARWKVYLTGTPICNRPMELFGLIHSLDSQAWNSRWKYLQRYCGMVKTRFGYDMSGASNLEELQDRLRSTIMIRRLKKDVLTELPPKRRQVIEFAVGKADVESVRREVAAFEKWKEVLAELRVAVELSKASERQEDYDDAVQRLRQGVSASFAEISKLRHETAVAKIPHVIAHLHDAIDESDEKVILFAHHLDVIQKIADEFGKMCVTLTGQSLMEDRQRAVDRFQKDASCKLFVGGIMAAGVGLTLTAASHVVFAELDWVPGNVSQAEDRAHRIGQKNSVLVQHLVLEGSLDAKMARTLIHKQEIIDRALDKSTEDRTMPVAPEEEQESAATQSAKRDQILKDAEKMTPEMIQAVHLALQMLAGMCDGARQLDGSGFNKVDSRIGHSLAEAPRLSAKQAALGMRIARKYHRQLPADVVVALDESKEEAVPAF